MKLNFKKIQIHNFKSFADETLDFHSVNGLVQVIGNNLDLPLAQNGSGKTNLFSAILYCLFGEIDQKIKNKNLKNRYVSSKDLSVGLLIDVDKSSYKIVRGLTKNNTTYLNVYDVTDGNEKDITKANLVDTQAFIENEILHCDISIFLRTIFLTSDQNYNFFRLTSSAKKDFIEKLFNISVFGEMFDLIHKDSLAFSKNISALQNQLLVLTKNNDDFQERYNNFDEKKKETLSELKAKIEELDKELSSLKETNVEMNYSSQEKISENIQRAETFRTNFNKNREEAERKLKSIENEIHKLDTNKVSNQKIVEKHTGILKVVCDDCKPKVLKYYNLDKYLKEIKAIDLKLEKDNADKKDVEKEISDNKANLEKVEKKIKELNDKLNELTIEYNKIMSQVSFKEQQLKQLNSQYEKEESSENPYKQLFEENKVKLNDVSGKLEELDSKYNYLKFAENIVSQDTLKKFIIKDLVILLNNRIKTYLSKIGTTYNCVFDENMDYHFVPNNSEECEYGNFSAGERMRLTIAASFAFRDFLATRNNLTSNILVLDEFIDSNLDSTSVEEILKILQSFTRAYNQEIFVISHRKEIDTSIFDSLLLVKKENNISHVEIQKNEK